MPDPALSDPVASFWLAARAAVADDTFVRLTLSQPHPAAGDLRQVRVRLVEIAGERRLSLTRRRERSDETANLAPEEAWVTLPALLTGSFRRAHLLATGGDLELDQPPGAAPRLRRRPPTQTAIPPRTHDEPRRVLLGPDAPFLRALGIAGADGRILPSRADKYRQIAQFTELLDHQWTACGLAAEAAPRLVDLASGKGYLTFAAWHYLRRIRGQEATVTGLELRPELVETCRRAAAELGCVGLSFEVGRIGQSDLGPVQAVLALHACDTATDEALALAVRAGARLILAAPCCQHELAPQLLEPAALPGLLAHGLVRQRLADLLTDHLRALLLQAAGYHTQLGEFIAVEHTPKNLLLSARRTDPFRPDPGAAEACQETLRLFGIQHFTLARLLTEPASDPAR